MQKDMEHSGGSNHEITTHNTNTPIPLRKAETTYDMLRAYLPHIFQYCTPEERIKYTLLQIKSVNLA